MPTNLDKTIARLPFVRAMFGDDDVQKLNSKFDMFDKASLTKDKAIQRLSIVNQYDNQMEMSASAGGKIPNVYFQQMMYGQSSDSKKRRLTDYKMMSQYPEVECALREICDEMFVKDDQGEVVKCALRGDYNDEIQSLIRKEFQKFIMVYKFDEKGWKYAKEFITEGELVFENIVSAKKPQMGIIGVTKIANERVDPLYYDLDNELIDTFILRSRQLDDYPFQWGKMSAQGAYNKNNQEKIVFLNDKQVSYFYNDEWEGSAKKFRIPHLANAERPYRQLSMIEDATIIYMLVRAPERFVFNIDTGTMPTPKAEAYVRNLMGKFWSKKTMANDGRIENTYDPISMTENFYFPKSKDGQGSTVESLGGGSASPDNLEILNFFVQKLYKSLHVPLARLNSETAFSDGESITREELRFAKFIISIQKQWASALKKSFIVHLKLRGRKVIDQAKKAGVEEIPVKNDKGGTDNLKVSQVYKDNFDNKCWDYYDVLNEQIDAKIEEMMVERNSLVDDLAAIDEKLSNLEDVYDNGVIMESAIKSNLLAEAEEIGKSVGEYDTSIEELKGDGRSWWDQYDLKEEDIDIKLNEPSQFFALREQQIFQLKYDNFNNMSQNDLVDNIFCQKVYLGWNDEQIKMNMEMLRKTAALRWELANIEANGPDFREKALEEAEAAMSGEDIAGLGGDMGGGGSLPGASDTDLPDFGAPPEGGAEGGAPPAAPEGAPQGGGDLPPAAPK